MRNFRLLCRQHGLNHPGKFSTFTSCIIAKLVFDVPKDLRVLNFKRNHQTRNRNSFDWIYIYFVVQEPIHISNCKHETALLQLHTVTNFPQHIQALKSFPDNFCRNFFLLHKTKFINDHIPYFTQIYFNLPKQLLNWVMLLRLGLQRGFGKLLCYFRIFNTLLFFFVLLFIGFGFFVFVDLVKWLFRGLAFWNLLFDFNWKFIFLGLYYIWSAFTPFL